MDGLATEQGPAGELNRQDGTRVWCGPGVGVGGNGISRSHHRY
jgi:hypothetical protein